MKAALVTVLLAACCMAPTATSATNSKSMTHSITHYDLDIPDTYTLRDVSPPMSDFALYEVRGKGGGPTLGLYFGNHPHFPKLKWDGPPVSSSSEGKTADEYPYSPRTRQLEGRMTFSGLRFRASRMSPFSSVHYFAADLDEDSGKAFTAIVHSIRVARATFQ